MSKKDDYIVRRQLKAIKTRGKRHSSTITGNFLGLFPQPLDIRRSEAKTKSKDVVPAGPNMLENMTISIDLDVKDISHHEDFIQMLLSIIKLEKVEKGFKLLSTAEKIIRALARAKFKNVAVIELDGKVLYRHPEKFYDVNDAIEYMIIALHKEKHQGNNIFMELLSHEHKDCLVEVNVSRVHLEWTHDILIRFQGVLQEEYFRRVINYLEEHLEIEDIEKEWKNA